MKAKVVLTIGLSLLFLTGLLVFGWLKARHSRSEALKARSVAQEVAKKLAVQRQRREYPSANTPVFRTVTVQGRLLDQDGKPLGQRVLGFVKDGVRLGDAGFGFMSDGLTADDGSFRFAMPVGQSWQALLPQGGTFDGPRSEALNIAASGTGTALPDHELELRLAGTKLEGRLRPLRPVAPSLR